MMKFFYVALGGAIGAVSRYAVSLLPLKSEFPFLTFMTNILGAFLIGLIAGFAEKQSLPENFILFVKTGICGGFTTFSTFSLETYQLLENKSFLTGSCYMLFSVFCCLLGVWLGRKLAFRLL